jgi:hypothetical protein
MYALLERLICHTGFQFSLIIKYKLLTFKSSFRKFHGRYNDLVSQYNILIYTYKALHDECPIYIKRLLEVYKPTEISDLKTNQPL